MKSPKTPYFILNKAKLINNYNEFTESCKKVLGKNNFHMAYSIKTNSLSEIIKVLANQGSGFEAASLNELKLVKSSNKLVNIFNGPCKTQEELKFAIKKKFLINVDSISEIDTLAKLTKSSKTPLNIGLRVSFSDSKFGINDREVEKAIDYVKSKNLKINCIHFHQGTQQNFKDYEESIIMFENLLKRLNLKLNYIDIGSGFPDKQQLKNIGKTIEDYLQVIKNHLYNFKAKIILEPGRAIVSDCMSLITKVQVIKENLGKTYAILDAGINLLPKITLSSYKFSKLNNINNIKKTFHLPHLKRCDLFVGFLDDPKSKTRKLLPHPKGCGFRFIDIKSKTMQSSKDEININNKSKEYLLAGPLLFSNDILGKFQGNLQEGDLVQVENVGAYCLNLAWAISYSKPKIIIT